MDSVAFVFPGQGSQYVGMGRELSASSAAARRVFEEADEALGEALTELVFEGDSAQLELTVNAQPAILAASVAYLRALEEAWGTEPGSRPRPRFYAGHSMGQYSALVAAGALRFADALRLVRERGHQMQASASDGAMAAVMGLDEARLPELQAAGTAPGSVSIANRNSAGQVVISGPRDAIHGAAEAARSLGAKRAVVLPVTVAAHSPLMARAADAMRAVVASVDFADPAAPLLANADARQLASAEACRLELVAHLTTGVDWVATVETMWREGVRTFVEIGPGRVLTGLIKRIVPEAEVVAVDEPTAPGRLRVPELPSLLAAAPAPGPA